MATAERLLLDKTWFDDGRLFASWRPPARRSPGAIVGYVQARLRRPALAPLGRQSFIIFWMILVLSNSDKWRGKKCRKS